MQFVQSIDKMQYMLKFVVDK